MTQSERNYRRYDRMCTLIAIHGSIGIGIDYSTALQRLYYWKLRFMGFTRTGLTYETCVWINKREDERKNRIKRTELTESEFHRHCEKTRWERGY